MQSEFASLSYTASSENSSRFCAKHHARKHCHPILGITLITFKLCTFEEQWLIRQSGFGEFRTQILFHLNFFHDPGNLFQKEIHRKTSKLNYNFWHLGPKCKTSVSNQYWGYLSFSNNISPWTECWESRGRIPQNEV